MIIGRHVGGCRDARSPSGVLSDDGRDLAASRHPEYGYAPPGKGGKPGEAEGKSSVVLVFFALNGNTIIFAALHSDRKRQRPLGLLDIRGFRLFHI